VVLLLLTCYAQDLHIRRTHDDWAFLTFAENGIIQNYVKCNPEVKERCEVDPKEVRSPYTQTLAAYALTAIDLVKKNPKFHETAKVLLIGMGPAALGRFWHHHFPNMQLDHVEISQSVVQHVNNTLPLPISPKFGVYVDDALHFVNAEVAKESSKRKKYDIIIHDAYDGEGPVAAVNTLSFYNGIRKLVESTSENGIVVSNFWILNATFTRETAMKYKEVFGNVRIVGVPLITNFEGNVAFVAHSMTRKDDLVCSDKICKSKRSQSSRNKVSPICSEISEYTKLAREITAGNDMRLDLEAVTQEAWERRPFVLDPEFC